jgi:hypothetical protein
MILAVGFWPQVRHDESQKWEPFHVEQFCKLQDGRRSEQVPLAPLIAILGP